MTRPRVLIGLATLGALLAVVAAAFIAFAFVTIGTCGGDGGTPYSARDSAAGRFCESAAVEVWGTAIGIVPPLIVLVTGAVAIGRRSWRWLVTGASVALGLVVVMWIGVAVLPG